MIKKCTKTVAIVRKWEWKSVVTRTTEQIGSHKLVIAQFDQFAQPLGKQFSLCTIRAAIIHAIIVNSAIEMDN